MIKTDNISYLKGLGDLLLKMEANDASGKAVSLEEGVDRAIDIIVKQANLRKKIIFIGNGGSAAIASHQAVDYWKNGGMRAQAFNDTSLLTCISNDYSYAQVFEKPMEMFTDPGDVLIAISSSGKSENILRGVKANKAFGNQTITMSGFKSDNPLRSTGDINFYVPAPTGAYGFVEIAHLVLCHMFVDLIIDRNLIKTPNGK
jgi:D-sedoheptulose 7-phosphate isomerase